VSNVLKHAVVAAVAAISSLVSAGVVVAFAPHQPALRAAKAETQFVRAPAQVPAAASATIAKSTDGHFWARGTVNGASVRFLVDTGATAVALTPADAERLGLTHGSRAVITSGDAKIRATVVLRAATPAGSVFMQTGIADGSADGLQGPLVKVSPA